MLIFSTFGLEATQLFNLYLIIFFLLFISSILIVALFKLNEYLEDAAKELENKVKYIAQSSVVQLISKDFNISYNDSLYITKQLEKELN